MKIFLMDTIDPSIRGTSTIHKFELLRNLSGLGHEIHSITSKDIKIDEVHAHPFKLKKKQGFWRLLYLYQLRHAVMLLKLIKTNRFDILYTRNISIGIFGYITRKKGTKLVLEMNGILPFERRQKQLKEKGHFIKNGLEDVRIAWLKYTELFFAKKVDAIIAVTEEIKIYLAKHGVDENKIWVIENGANTELFRPIENNAVLNELKNKLSINNDENVVIYVGSFRPWQGIETLLRAAPLIIEEIPKTKFLIVGGGKGKGMLKGSLMRKVFKENNFIITGIVPYQDVPKYINISNICVTPFIKGRVCSPLKLFEFLSCAKPIVSSDIAGVREILNKSTAGILVTPENHVELAEQIIRLLKDKELQERMRIAGRQYVIQNHSWEITAIKTINVFEEIIK